MRYKAILLLLPLIVGCAKTLPSCWENRHVLPEEEYRACLRTELTRPPTYVPVPEERVNERRMEQERVFYQYGTGVGTLR